MKRRPYADHALPALTRDDPVLRNVGLWGSALVAGLFVVAGATLWQGFYAVALLFGLLFMVAAHDFFQTKHTLRRNFPLTGRLRWFLEDLRPFTRAYFVESDLEGRPFNHEQRALIYARAKGERESHPFGTELDVYAEGYESLAHSMAPSEASAERARVRVGGADCSKPYDAALLNISAMSYGSLGQKAIEALNRGAAIGGFYHDTGEGGISPYHRNGGDLVWELGTGYFGARTTDGEFCPDAFADKAADDQVVMTELKLSQGAKPGKGGMLPAAKVTQEIAEIRGVPRAQNVYSPARHKAFSTPIELLEFIAKMRDLSGGKPVGIKFCVGYPHEVLALSKAMILTGIRPDFMVVDGGEGGTGAAPQEMSDHIGLPLREGLIIARNALVGCGLKDEVKLAAAGKVHSSAGMAMQFALGADWCNAGRAFMFALGCIQSQHCHTDQCPTGVATTSPARQWGLHVPTKAERVARFQAATLQRLSDLMVAAGIEDHREFEPFHLRQRVSVARMVNIDRVYEFLEPGALLADPDATKYARWWRMAQAESFRPVCR
ncbi:MAG: FMN-binding glutamate synthase family protein [Pacificimonas sp.]|nr:FMN-binding glutamate synthase family protein [Pacificimonas sp.]